MNLNTNTGVVKAKKNRSIVIELPRGGTFTFKTNREFKVGDHVCFTVDTILNIVTDVIPKKEADTIVQVADAEAWGGVLGNMDGLDLEDEDIGFDTGEDDLEFLDEEDPIDGDTIDNTGQEPKGPFDFGCGEDRADVINPADYFAADEEDVVDEADGPTH